ncbi:NUDIX domain-containing protein [Streptococcus rifensis]
MEIWDIYDDQHHLTGEKIAREDVLLLKEGQYHVCVNAFLRDIEGNFLVQQRSWKKETNPGVWVLFTGGSILTGETPEKGIAREVAEELGLKGLAFNHLGYEVRPDIKSIMHYYMAKIPQVSKEQIKLQQSEIHQIAWIPPGQAND